ncbi:MAG: ADP-ribosylglycohydrolase family protein [Angelakisella sp.]
MLLKRILIGVLSVSMVVSLSACGNTNPPAASSASTATSTVTQPNESSTGATAPQAGYERDRDMQRNPWLAQEVIALWEEGYEIDVAAYRQKVSACNGNRLKEEALYHEMQALPLRADFPYREPTSYEDIMKQVPESMGLVENPSNEEMDDRFYGAWLGRFVGSCLGMPVEMWSAKNIRTWVEKAGKWPLDYYIPTTSPAATENGLRLNSLTTTSDKITFAPSDDDTRFTFSNLQVLRLYNITWDTWDLGSVWLWSMPFRLLCTAERTAFLNFAMLDDNYMGGKPGNAKEIIKKTATYMNPYREWIGAQIRADVWGYAFAGNPRQAAKIAYKDAALTHVKNGIYGEMFMAAMISAAFGERNVETLVDRALAEIPTETRLHEAITKTKEFVSKNKNPDAIIQWIEDNYGHYNPIHTINNAAICVAAVLYSQGDFEKAITFAAISGMDVDCNCATVGSILGAYNGANKIPAKWKDVISDDFYPYGQEKHSIAQLAKETKLQWEIYGE